MHPDPAAAPLKPLRLRGALVIGAGPAGLIAAEALSDAGHPVTLVDAMPSIGRKFLMAGKSGLNLTNAAPPERLLAAYGTAADWLAPMLKDFGPDRIANWAEGLGQPLFTGSSGRVFPVAMKASPLLRALRQRLLDHGVRFRTGLRWTGWAKDNAENGKQAAACRDAGEVLLFRSRAGGTERLCAGAVVLALGGASWSRLGSDGAWVPWLGRRGVGIAPFRPANMGFRVAWSEPMRAHLGKPVKPVVLQAGQSRVRAEFVISEGGIEGGGVYAVARALREGAVLRLDLAPDRDLAGIMRRLAMRPRGESTANRLRKGLGLSPVAIALIHEFARPLPRDAGALARLIKGLPVRHDGPRPLDEAISSAGGVQREALDPGLMLRALPGVFAAGEMLDWEAPTGGYLLTACLATGHWAGRHAAQWLDLEAVRSGTDARAPFGG